MAMPMPKPMPMPPAQLPVMLLFSPLSECSFAGSNKMKCFKFKCKVRSWPAESCERERERGRKECQTDWTAGWTAETALAETRGSAGNGEPDCRLAQAISK